VSLLYYLSCIYRKLPFDYLFAICYHLLSSFLVIHSCNCSTIYLSISHLSIYLPFYLSLHLSLTAALCHLSLLAAIHALSLYHLLPPFHWVHVCAVIDFRNLKKVTSTVTKLQKQKLETIRLSLSLYSSKVIISITYIHGVEEFRSIKDIQWLMDSHTISNRSKE